MKFVLHTCPYFLFIVCISLNACSKPKSATTPAPPAPKPGEITLTVDPSAITLARDQPYLGRVVATVKNLPAGESADIVWSSDDPRIASVTNTGIVYPKGAGETYITAALANGKAAAKCKVTITDKSDFKFRIVLKDKGPTVFSIGSPQFFLSPKAIERRRKRNIPVDETDLPISAEYIKAIQQLGGIVVAQSKWLKTVTVHCSDQFLSDKFRELPFVEDVIMVWEGRRGTAPVWGYADHPQTGSNTATWPIDYGASFENISVHKGQELHAKGFKGAGIDIAVIDAGFLNMQSDPMFRNIHIKGAKSFVYENDDPYAESQHGVWVTSCMAVNKPGTYVGTAPEASYWLLRTEVDETEYPVEEDYWVNAIEFADSVGADIVNSSLTYTDGYALLSARYKFEQMDGKTAFATRGANMAFNKGIFIVNCSGNESSWVGTPADAPGVLTVGSVNSRLTIDHFSSWGITVDGRMKPDVVARGGGVNVVNAYGTVEIRSGSSYASPNMCGIAACLWQAFPHLSNQQLLELIRKSADRAGKPEIPFGYGLPDMQKAMELAAPK